MGQSPQRLTDSGIESYLTSVHVNYRAALDPWLTTYPDAQLTFTPYLAVKQAGGSIAHFRATSGLTLPDDLQDAPHQNSGLHPALYEIARLGYAALPKGEAWHLLTWLETCHSRLNLPPADQVEMLGRDNRALLADAFAPTHRYLSSLVGGSAFFADIDQIRETKPISMAEASNACLADVTDLAKETLPASKRTAFLADLLRTGIPPASQD